MAISEDHTATALPSLADQKLDRQLRLWGAEGQRALQSTCVVLFGATATGCEALKNVILPNMGSFRIIDNQTITARHLGSNFFLDPDSEGQLLATNATALLSELNPDVVAHPPETRFSATEAVHALLRGDTSLLGKDFSTVSQRFILLTTTLVSEAALQELSKALETACGSNNEVLERTIALMHIESTGLIGAIRVQSKPLFIHHAHPSTDTVVSDLAITRPFPALKAWFDAHNPNDDEQFGVDIDKHSHLPWPCILYFAIEKMRQERGEPNVEKLLATHKDFVELKKFVTSLRRRVQPQQECIAEALDKCKMTIDVRRRVSPQLQAIFDDIRCQQPSATDDLMWFVCHGLREFREKHNGFLPLTGVLPDITTYTHWYSELQDVYRGQAALEADEVLASAQRALQQAGATVTITTEALKALVTDVCTHSWELSFVAFNTIAAERACPDYLARLFASSTDDEAFLSWYAALRGQSLFRAQQQRAPGDCNAVEDIANEAKWGDDVALLQTLTLEKILGETRRTWSDERLEGVKKRVRELCRYGGGELASTAAVVGAVAGQEMIKLAQRRRVPAHDVIVFDGNVGAFGTLIVL